ncbi:MAG: hypothetical protein KGQ49_05755, partial [Verrucomicrobia bacterium]|nr:hypothetical protein [Verrucomicrobiota bacterium]
IQLYEAISAETQERDACFFCWLMLGECRETLGYLPAALDAYRTAFSYNPTRAEPLHRMARVYRLQDNPWQAYNFAKQGKACPYNSSTLVHQLDEELSIAAYYTPFREEGFRAINRLLLGKNVPDAIKSLAIKNSRFYLSNLKGLQLKEINVDLPQIQEHGEERYHPMNPSIIKTNNGYEVILRSVNYTIQEGKYYHTIDPDGKIRTRNFLLSYDPSFKLLQKREIVDALHRPRIDSAIEGLEDARLFQYRDRLWFSCTTCDTSIDKVPQISLCKLSPKGSEILFLDRLWPLLGPEIGRCEKNWLPFIHQEKLLTVYGYAPFRIFELDPESESISTFLEYDPPYDCSRFRGSAPPIAFDGGYLMLVHEVLWLDNECRVYTHRFLWLDQTLHIGKISRPFVFNHQGIECCFGIVLNPEETELILSIGMEDKQAYLGWIDVETIRSLFSD